MSTHIWLSYFHFFVLFSLSQFQPQESYFEKWLSKGQILSYCCCWLIQLFDHEANGHNLHKWNLQFWMINCQKAWWRFLAGRVLNCFFFCFGHPQKRRALAKMHQRETQIKNDEASTEYNCPFHKASLNSCKVTENNFLDQTVTLAQEWNWAWWQSESNSVMSQLSNSLSLCWQSRVFMEE